MADDIWIYDFKTKQIENLTNNIVQDIFPMWAGDRSTLCQKENAQPTFTAMT